MGRLLVLALVLGAGAYAVSWLWNGRAKHPAETAFAAFYWELQSRDLAAASELVLPGSEAEQALAEQLELGAVAPLELPIARGFELDLRYESDGELAGRPAIRLRGQATVSVDPPGYASAFGVQVPHEVDARLVEDGGRWRVAAFRDTVVAR